MTIVKGDQIQVISGREKGKRGTVEQVLVTANTVVVSGVNMRKHHLKPRAGRPQGGIVESPAPLRRANVMVVCPHCSKPTRISHTVTPEGKFRACSHCKDSLDKK